MSDFKEIINELCKSDFLPEWILKLKANGKLFSPKTNIKPCIKIDDDHVRSTVWEGLLLIDNYCRRSFDNPDVDNFIVSLLNESIDLYKNDKEEDPYLKLNSSNIILQLLLEIILSKPKFVNETNFISFIEIYLDGVLTWPFSLVYELYKSRKVLTNSNPGIVFLVYKLIIEKRNKRNDFEKYLIVPELIFLNPIEYYNYSKEILLNYDDIFYDMSSFYEYNSHFHQYEMTYFEWFKIASKRIDAQSLLNDIVYFINSTNNLLKKIGLCLININFEKCEKIFLKNFDLFLNDEAFYADLKCIFIGNASFGFVKNNADLIKEKLQNATFGLDNNENIIILKNHLYGILNKRENIFPYIGENNENFVFASNFNKKIYSINYDSNLESKKIYDGIIEKDFDDVVEDYHRRIGGSYFFDDVLHNSYRRYVCEKHPDDFEEYIEKFDSGFLINLIHYYSSDSYKDLNSIRRIVKKAVFLINTIEYKGAISSVLSALKLLINHIPLKEFTEIFNNIDYKIFAINDYESYDRIITICINENVYSYFVILVFLCNKKSVSEKKLIDVIKYYIEKSDSDKLKSILASVYPKLLTIIFEYAISIENYIFDNEHKNQNLSYPLVSISNCTDLLLDRISIRSDFINYVKVNSSDGDIQMSQQVILSWFLKKYIFEECYDNIIDLLFEYKKYDIILENLRTINHWINNQCFIVKNVKRYYLYLEKFCKVIVSSDDNYDADQFIREIASSMVLLNESNDFLWGLIFTLFKNFDHYFADECVELIKKYKDEDVKNTVKLLDMYFEKYDKYISFEDTLVEVFNMVRYDKNYDKKIKEWQVSLTKKNINLKSKIC